MKRGRSKFIIFIFLLFEVMNMERVKAQTDSLQKRWLVGIGGSVDYYCFKFNPSNGSGVYDFVYSNTTSYSYRMMFRYYFKSHSYIESGVNYATICTTEIVPTGINSELRGVFPDNYYVFDVPIIFGYSLYKNSIANISFRLGLVNMFYKNVFSYNVALGEFLNTGAEIRMNIFKSASLIISPYIQYYLSRDSYFDSHIMNNTISYGGIFEICYSY